MFLAIVAGLFYWFMIHPYSYRWKPCYGSKEYQVCIPSGFHVYGIDVSHHQGKIDWNSVASVEDRQFPISFTFIKATEGATFLDGNYSQNADSARNAGLMCGAYHFFNPSTSAAKQADFFIRNVSLRRGDLPPVLDVEKRPESKQKMQREVLVWLETVEKYYGVRPIIYTSYKFRKNYLDTPQFDKYPFWIAHYYVDYPDPQMEWAFWQFTDRGRVNGIGEQTDINVYYGSAASLDSLRVRRSVPALGK